MRILGVVPARGGSKGIPRKNIRVLAGKPLIAWTIETARQSDFLTDLVVSTDDHEIAEISRAWGATVPFMRPAELAADNTPGVMTALHALRALPEYDNVILLQPTTPLRTAVDIDGLIRECIEAGAPAAVSVVESNVPPEWTFTRSSTGLFQIDPNFQVPDRRQDLPTRYSVKGGGLYLAQREWLIKRRNFLTPETYMYIMPARRCVDVDTEFDWEVAEYQLLRHKERSCLDAGASSDTTLRTWNPRDSREAN